MNGGEQLEFDFGEKPKEPIKPVKIDSGYRESGIYFEPDYREAVRDAMDVYLDSEDGIKHEIKKIFHKYLHQYEPDEDSVNRVKIENVIMRFQILVDANRLYGKTYKEINDYLFEESDGLLGSVKKLKKIYGKDFDKLRKGIEKFHNRLLG